MNNDINNAKNFIACYVSQRVNELIKPLYYENDFSNMDLSSIHEADKWETDEDYDDFDDKDKFNHETSDSGVAYTLTGKEVYFSEVDIFKTYKLVYVGCENIEYGEIRFTLIILKNKDILFVEYSGD